MPFIFLTLVPMSHCYSFYIWILQHVIGFRFFLSGLGKQGSQQIHLNNMSFNAQPRPFPGLTEHLSPLGIFSSLSRFGKQNDVQFIDPKNLAKRGF